jgi:hypothetical protein
MKISDSGIVICSYFLYVFNRSNHQSKPRLWSLIQCGNILLWEMCKSVAGSQPRGHWMSNNARTNDSSTAHSTGGRRSGLPIERVPFSVQAGFLVQVQQRILKNEQARMAVPLLACIPMTGFKCPTGYWLYSSNFFSPSVFPSKCRGFHSRWGHWNFQLT